MPEKTLQQAYAEHETNALIQEGQASALRKQAEAAIKAAESHEAKALGERAIMGALMEQIGASSDTAGKT